MKLGLHLKNEVNLNEKNDFDALDVDKLLEQIDGRKTGIFGKIQWSKRRRCNDMPDYQKENLITSKEFDFINNLIGQE